MTGPRPPRIPNRTRSVATLSAQLRAFGDQFVAEMNDTARDVCYVAAENVIIGGPFGNPTGTPVDTGYARAQWTPTMENPAYEVGEVDPSGGAVLARVTGVLMQYQLGIDFWLTNGAVYIRPLEHGHSREQAPLGMVSPMLANAQQIVDHVVRLRRGGRSGNTG